jgi:hypothetical protein
MPPDVEKVHGMLMWRAHGAAAAAAASKRARRSAVLAARCAMKHYLFSSATRVSHRGCRTCGLPMAKGGFVTSLRQPARYNVIILLYSL